jgi:hypothetical protein
VPGASRSAHSRIFRRWPLASLLLGLVLAASCGGPIGVDSSVPVIGGLGEAQLALEIPTAGNVDRIEYKLTFTFLESDPPVVYNTEEFVSELHGGELVAVLPCWTERDGDGLNQVDIEAKIYFEGDEEPIEVSSSAVFTCVRNADVLVNVVLNVVTTLDAGFGDLDVAVTGTLCASKVDFKGDEYQGVCAGSSCGGTKEVFLFANNCITLHNQVPEYWVCGAPTDWVLRGSLANSLFPIPAIDGSWDFGVIALEPLKMLQVDPSLTDAEGNLKVWGQVSQSRAKLVRSQSVITAAEATSSKIDFAAELQVPLQEGQLSAPKILLTATETESALATPVVGWWTCGSRGSRRPSF